MARRLLNLLGFLSLLVCVVAATAWAQPRSERFVREIGFGEPRWLLACGEGRVTLDDGPRWRAEWHEIGRTLTLWINENERLLATDGYSLGLAGAVWRTDPPRAVRVLTDLAAERERLPPPPKVTPPRPVSVHSVSLPTVVLLTAALPAAQAIWAAAGRRRRRAHARRVAGLCAQCGYDVRATPTTCPECGCAVGGVNNLPRVAHAPATGKVPPACPL